VLSSCRPTWNEGALLSEAQWDISPFLRRNFCTFEDRGTPFDDLDAQRAWLAGFAGTWAEWSDDEPAKDALVVTSRYPPGIAGHGQSGARSRQQARYSGRRGQESGVRSQSNRESAKSGARFNISIASLYAAMLA
jgi:hypothetical protein